MLNRIEKDRNDLKNYGDNVAHELRTPLTRMQSSLDLVLSQNKSESEIKEVIVGVRTEVSRLVKMTNSMLLLARGNAGMEILNRTPVNLQTFVDDLLEMYSPLAEQSKINLICHNSVDEYFELDEILFFQAISNLVENALSYSCEGDTVNFNISLQNKTLNIILNDTGSGIPEDQLTNIFNRFNRGKNQKTDSGFGLGLAISKMIIEAHGGKINLESTINTGTTISIDI